MHKMISSLILAMVLTAGAFAENGLGLSATLSGVNNEPSGVAAFGATNTFVTAKLDLASSDTVILEPFVSFAFDSETDPDNVSADYIDGYTHTYLAGGLNYFNVYPLGESLRFLIGVGGSIGTNLQDAPGSTADYTNVTAGVTLPAALEVRALPQIGVRVEGALASAGFVYDNYSYDLGSSTYTSWSARLGFSALALGFYYYF